MHRNKPDIILQQARFYVKFSVVFRRVLLYLLYRLHELSAACYSTSHPMQRLLFTEGGYRGNAAVFTKGIAAPYVRASTFAVILGKCGLSFVLLPSKNRRVPPSFSISVVDARKLISIRMCFVAALIAKRMLRCCLTGFLTLGPHACRGVMPLRYLSVRALLNRPVSSTGYW